MLKKKMLSVCLIMALILSMNSMVTFAATWVYADTYGISYGYYSNNININVVDLADSYMDGLYGAINAWNNAQTSYSIKISSTATNYVYSSALNTTTYAGVPGYYSVSTKNSNSWRNCTKFTIVINTRVVTSSASYNYERSVFCHELGHAMSLRDLDTSYTTEYATKSIMSYSRNRETLCTPQSLDIYNAVLFVN